MGKTSLETYQEFYNSDPELSPEWYGVELFAANSSVLGESLSAEVNAVGSDVNLLTVQAGFNALEQLPQDLRELLRLAQEQAAAEQLHENFGPPKCLSAIPVLMLLMKNEFWAKLRMKMAASRTSELIERTTNQAIFGLKLFLAERINKIDVEIDACKKDLETAVGVVSETGGALYSTMTVVKPKFDHETNDLVTKRVALQKTFERISGGINSLVQRVGHTVYSAATQSTEIRLATS